MNEIELGLLALLCILISATYAFLCMLGGRSQEELDNLPAPLNKVKNRIWGRVLAPIFLSLSICALALFTHHFTYWMLLSTPAYFVSHRMGYGGSKLWIKITRRTLWSTIRTSSSATFALFTGTWTLFVCQLILGLLSANVLGTRNPLKAPQEEYLNNFLSVAFVPFMVL